MPPVNQQSNGADLSHIADDLHHLAVPISSILPDPCNARLHPEVNLDGIKASLEQFGQVKPIVVNKRTNVVCAGNGTLEAAKRLGWKWIAAIFRNWDDGTTNAFALADNTTADVAQWDMESKARLIRLIEESGRKPVCISDDEIMQLRTLEFVPPPLDDSEEDTTEGTYLSEASKEKLAENMVIDRAVELCRKIEGNELIARQQALYIISYHYLNCATNRGSSHEVSKPI